MLNINMITSQFNQSRFTLAPAGTSLWWSWGGHQSSHRTSNNWDWDCHVTQPITKQLICLIAEERESPTDQSVPTCSCSAEAELHGTQHAKLHIQTSTFPFNCVSRASHMPQSATTFKSWMIHDIGTSDLRNTNNTNVTPRMTSHHFLILQLPVKQKNSWMYSQCDCDGHLL